MLATTVVPCTVVWLARWIGLQVERKQLLGSLLQVLSRPVRTAVGWEGAAVEMHRLRLRGARKVVLGLALLVDASDRRTALTAHRASLKKVTAQNLMSDYSTMLLAPFSFSRA